MPNSVTAMWKGHALLFMTVSLWWGLISGCRVSIHIALSVLCTSVNIKRRQCRLLVDMNAE